MVLHAMSRSAPLVTRQSSADRGDTHDPRADRAKAPPAPARAPELTQGHAPNPGLAAPRSHRVQLLTETAPIYESRDDMKPNFGGQDPASLPCGPDSS